MEVSEPGLPQLEDCRKKAEAGWEVVGEFHDEGFSSYSGNRGPDLGKAKRAAAEVAEEHGAICALVSQYSIASPWLGR